LQTNTKPQNDDGDDDDGREGKKYIYEEKSTMNEYHRKKRCESKVVE
jgi:hypothetical protein